MSQLEGKVALVTGASRGIGKAIASQLAAQGATVVGTATSESGASAITEYLSEFGGKGIALNVTDKDSIDAIIKEINDTFGGIDILVNNAGITRDKTLVKMEEEQWTQVINTNLNSMFNVTKQVLPNMIEQNFGRIINISSVVGIIGNFGQTNYAAAKAGILGFTKSLALESARKGITVNAICPGFIETEMTALMPEKAIEMIKGLIPMHRMGKPLDIARAALFLSLIHI